MTSPFNVTILRRESFPTEEAARLFAAKLTGRFEPVLESEIDLKNVTVIVPVKEASDEARRAAKA